MRRWTPFALIAFLLALLVVSVFTQVWALPHEVDSLDSSSYGWLRAMVGCMVAFIVLVVSAFIALSVMGYATPVMLGLIAGGLVALIIVASLLVFLGANSVVRQYSRG